VEVSPATEQSKKSGNDVIDEAVSNWGKGIYSIIIEKVKQLDAEVIELHKRNLILQEENKELKDQLNTAYALADFKQERLVDEPKEPVYDFKWLDVVLQKYNPLYRYYNDKDLVDIDIEINGRRNYISLGLKASAGIILEALAKELNVNNDSLIDYEIIAYQDGKYSVTRCRPETAYFGEVKFAWNTAQKAIDILSTHFPEVLKNYFL
jgi:hypothetical protein